MIVKRYGFIYLLLIIISYQDAVADSRIAAMEDGVADRGVVLCYSGKKWEDEITPKEWAGEIAVKVFTNKLSGRSLYYEGADGWGGGEYYVINNGKKQIICGKYNRQAPVVRWYGGDIVEIWVGANVSWHTYQYYDYTSETFIDQLDRHPLFGKPLCVDMENHYVIWAGSDSITVTDIRTQRHIAEYLLDEEDVDPYKAWIENDELIIFLKDRRIVFDYVY